MKPQISSTSYSESAPVGDRPNVCSSHGLRAPACAAASSLELGCDSHYSDKKEEDLMRDELENLDDNGFPRPVGVD